MTGGVQTGVQGADAPLAAGGPGSGWVSVAARQGLRQESLDPSGLSIFEPHRMEGDSRPVSLHNFH